MAARSTMSLDDRLTIATHMLSPERGYGQVSQPVSSEPPGRVLPCGESLMALTFRHGSTHAQSQFDTLGFYPQA